MSGREADQVATRETVADITALKLSVVDDRLRALVLDAYASIGRTAGGVGAAGG